MKDEAEAFIKMIVNKMSTVIDGTEILWTHKLWHMKIMQIETKSKEPRKNPCSLKNRVQVWA